MATKGLSGYEIGLVTVEGVILVSLRDIKVSGARFRACGAPANLEALVLMDIAALYAREGLLP